MNPDLVFAFIMLFGFPWIWSRAIAPYGSWSNDYVDVTVGGITVIGWAVSVMHSTTTGEYGDLASKTATEPLAVFVGFVGVGLWFVIVTWVFVKVRILIGAYVTT